MDRTRVRLWCGFIEFRLCGHIADQTTVRQTEIQTNRQTEREREREGVRGSRLPEEEDVCRCGGRGRVAGRIVVRRLRLDKLAQSAARTQSHGAGANDSVTASSMH